MSGELTQMIKNEKKELRKFAITMFVGFLVIGAISWWRNHITAAEIFGGLSLFFILFGLIIPKALKPIHWFWMKLAHYMGIVVTTILLTLTYYIVMTPIGWLSKLFGKDFLLLKFDKNAKSYWIAADPDGPASRIDKPF